MRNKSNQSNYNKSRCCYLKMIITYYYSMWKNDSILVELYVKEYDCHKQSENVEVKSIVSNLKHYRLSTIYA
jgi:hypothetical protein